MSAKKKAKKRLPKPVPCERWGIYSRNGRLVYVKRSEGSAKFWSDEDQAVFRVRITPVAKRRKGAK